MTATLLCAPGMFSLPLSRSGEFLFLTVLANCNREKTKQQRWKEDRIQKKFAPCAERARAVTTYFSHDCDGRLPFGLGHPVLDQVVHVLVVQQADQVEGAETCGAAQSQVPDHHGAAEEGGYVQNVRWKKKLEAFPSLGFTNLNLRLFKATMSGIYKRHPANWQ